MTGQSVSANERVFTNCKAITDCRITPTAGLCGLLLAIWIPLHHKLLVCSVWICRIPSFYHGFHQKERSQWALGGKLVCAEGYKPAIGQIFLCGMLLFFKVAATMWNKNLWASDLQSEILFYYFMWCVLLQGFRQIFIFFILQESHHGILVLAPLKMIVIEEIQTRQEHFFPRSHNDHSIISARPFSNNGAMVK